VATDGAYHHRDDCVYDHWTLDSVSDFGYFEKCYIKLKVITTTTPTINAAILDSHYYYYYQPINATILVQVFYRIVVNADMHVTVKSKLDLSSLLYLYTWFNL